MKISISSTTNTPALKKSSSKGSLGDPSRSNNASVSSSGLSFGGDILFVVAPRTQILSVLKQGAPDYSKAKKDRSEMGSETQSEVGDLITRYNLKNRIVQRSFNGKLGETLSVDLIEGPIGRLVLVGWEQSSNRFDELKSYRDLGAYITDQAKTFKANSLGLLAGNALFNAVSLDSENDGTKDVVTTVDAVEALIEGIELADYKFDHYISTPNGAVETKRSSRKEQLIMQTRNGGELALKRNLTIYTDKEISEKAIKEATVLAQGTKLARDLINLTPRDCTPSHLVETAQNIAKKTGLGVKVWDERDLKKMGAGAVLAVAQGSHQPAYIAKLTYKPKKPSKKILAIVGKGVTFDSGGLSLKTASGMETMKGDMSGAGAVLGAMQAISQLKPDIEVRGYIVTVENMPSGSATRPGDVVRAMNGKTIEILNTDAEGRLILADCLHLAEQEGATAIVDIATLTGAIVVALGSQCAGLFSDNRELANLVLKAGEASGERFWRMPLIKDHIQIAKSKIADYKNMGVAGSGGSIFAAVFLSLFVKSTPWAHLDIAGVFLSDRDKGHLRSGGVGFGVRTLARLAKAM